MQPSTPKPIQRHFTDSEDELMVADCSQESLAVKRSKMGLWYWDEVNQRLFWDTNTREMFGVVAEAEVFLETFYRALHPDDRDHVKRDWRYALEHELTYELEYRSLRPDGSTRWIHARGEVYSDVGRRLLGMAGVVFDITEGKQAEREHVVVNGRQAIAQEKGQKRLAREIRDDFSMKLALLAYEFEFVRSITGESSEEAIEQLDQLRSSASENGVDLYGLCNCLHSSILEYMGLAPAVRSYCADVAKQYQIQIEVHQNVPRYIPPGTAFCLFRILQEGLGNVIKHSAASRVDILLEGGAQAASLSIYDNGVGFELSNGFEPGGIGIIGMRERARMLGGTFEVVSQPERGTLVAVRAPIGIS